MKNNNISGIVLPFLASKVSDRYCFSEYIVDPNKYNWPKAVRVVAAVLRFIRLCRPKYKPSWTPHPLPTDGDPVVVLKQGTLDAALKFIKIWKPDFVPPPNLCNQAVLTKYDLRFGEKYFFVLATKEVQEYVPAKDQKDMDMRDEVLYYIGRVLDGQEVNSPVDTMFDVSPLKFVKPVIDRYSPIAYSIMVHSHSSIAHHRSSAATLR